MLRLENALITQGDFTLSADLTLEAEQKYAVIGPSGAGKSTLLNALCGFVPLEQGKLMWQGRDITAQPPGARPMTMLFQDNNLFPHLTALQNVVLGVDTGAKPAKQSLTRAKQALSLVDLAGMEHRRPADLSGGQQSRVALARTILSDRAVIGLDEPFAALGPGLRREMLDLMAQHLGTRTVLMVTHDPDDALRIADNTIVVANGTASSPAPTKALFENPTPHLRDYLG